MDDNMMNAGSLTDALAMMLLEQLNVVKLNLPKKNDIIGKSGAAAMLVNLAGAAAALDMAMHTAVALDRSRGRSWSEIGQYLGMSKQAAWQRFHASAGE